MHGHLMFSCTSYLGMEGGFCSKASCDVVPPWTIFG